MRLTVMASSAWIIAAIVDDRGRCSVREALDAVAITERAAHAEILALLSRVAQAGPPRDERRSRHLGGSIFELKTPRGFRVLYFFDRKRLIICSELSRKPKPRALRGMVRRAMVLREDYVAASAKGDVIIQIGE